MVIQSHQYVIGCSHQPTDGCITQSEHKCTLLGSLFAQEKNKLLHIMHYYDFHHLYRVYRVPLALEDHQEGGVELESL